MGSGHPESHLRPNIARPPLTVEQARRLALDDELSAHPRGQIVVVGCGNILRGDDAVGPTLIRHLWEQGVPDGVTLVDGGTAGMDVAFKMKGAKSVILIDAAMTGSEAGTIYRVPGSEVEQLPPLEGLHSHQFRWDHALAFAHWLLGDEYPDDITVYLIEASSTDPGADLTDRVEQAMHDVGSMIRAGWEDQPRTVRVELTADGDLRLSGDVAARFFPGDSLVAMQRGSELWLLPLIGPEGGGLLLKQRNAAGERSALVREALPRDVTPGPHEGFWDEENGALRVALSYPVETSADAG